jgi:hypothetical protein
VVDRDARQQHAALVPGAHDQPVAAELDLLRPDRRQPRERRDLDCQRAELGLPYRVEAVVLGRRRDRHAGHRVGQRLVGPQHADAAAQLAVAPPVKAHEGAARLGERPRRARQDRGAAGEVRRDRLARRLEQRAALFRAQPFPAAHASASTAAARYPTTWLLSCSPASPLSA